MQFNIENMTCEGCVRGVSKAIQRVDPNAQVKADLATKKVEVATELPRSAFLPALDEAGFTVSTE